MKRILAIIVIAIFLGVGGSAMSADEKPLPDRTKVLCPCGCESFAIQCGCANAMKALEDFDKKIKQLKGE